MDLFQVILLSVVQGITEWLPVSSSGHLVIAHYLLGIEADVFFNVALHVGTLIAVVAVFWKRIIELIKGFFSFDRENKEFRQSVLIIAATAVTAVIGFSFKGVFESFFSDLFVVGVALIATGCVLFATKYASKRRKISAQDSMIIGFVQGLAITPGLSRSGVTISAAMLRGIDKKEAAEFSFLLSIPAIIGAFIIKASEVSFSFGTEVLVGIAVSAVVGYFSIKVLLNVIQKGAFHYFAYYCWALGAVVLASLLL